MVKTLHHAVDERWLLDPAQFTEPMNWETVFGNRFPVEVEIGCGKGRFILSESADRPYVNFLGIERARKYLRISLDRLNRGGQSNVRMMCADAEFCLHQLIPKQSVQIFHIYFPDPWPKARHHKRRLVKPPVAQLLRDALVPGGEVRIASDHAEYFEHMVQVMEGSGSWANLEVWDTTAQSSNVRTATHFEIKFEREHRIVHRAHYQLHE